MDRQGMYKSRPIPGQTRNNRVRDQQNRGRAKRSEAYLQNRGLSDEHDETPECSPKVASMQNQPTLVMRSVNKLASKMNFTTKTDERVFKLQEMRKRNIKNSPTKRSPFVSVVPVGRILPKKRDILEDKMKEFHERRAKKINKSTKKRRSLGRRSGIGKPQLVVRKQPNRKAAVVVKPVTRPKNSEKKERKSAQLKITVPTIITDPIPGPSNPRPALKMRPPSAKKDGFLAPFSGIAAPKTKKKETRESFNICNSFITSTTSKSSGNVKLIPDEVENAEDTLLEGISPIPDVTPFKFTAKTEKSRSSRNSSKGLPIPLLPSDNDENEQNVEKIIDEPFKFEIKEKNMEQSTKEPTIDEELNITFTQETDEEIIAEGALIVKDDDEEIKSDKKRRSSIRKSLPVISEPEDVVIGDQITQNVEKEPEVAFVKYEEEEIVTKNDKKRRSSKRIVVEPENNSIVERNPIAKAHYETLESEIKRLTDRNAKWNQIKTENELNDNIVGLINSGIGQAQLLMRKKFPKFRELIENYEHKSGDRAVLADDLDGYWFTVTIEIENIDKRFAELEEYQANNWEEKEEKEQRPKVKGKRGRKKATTEKKGTVSETLKEHLKKIRENMKAKKEIPEYDAAPNVQLMQVKRLADTPRKSIPKRRSLNCSGCVHTPTSNRKSKSTKKVSMLAVTENSESAAKATRKSTKKLAFTESQNDIEVNETMESVPHRSILKSSNKRNTKSVLFAVEEPAPIKIGTPTPRRGRKNKQLNVSMDYHDENSPASTYNTPVDLSNITLTRGRPSRKSTPKPKKNLPISDAEDSPLSALPESRKRRSTRLFGNIPLID